jgi:hypothetical protein
MHSASNHPSREHFVARLISVRNAEHLWNALRGAGTAMLASSALVLLLVTIEAIAHASMQVRFGIWLALLLGVSGAVAYWVLPHVLRRIGIGATEDPTHTALRVGAAYPEMGDMLCNVLQLTESTTQTSELSGAAFERVAVVAEPLDFTVIVDREQPRRTLLLGLLSVACIGLVVGLAPVPFGAAWHRIMSYNTSFLPAAPYTLVLSPKRDTVMRGSSVRIMVRAEGVPPEELTINVREHGSDRFQPWTIKRDTGSTYVYTIPGITRSVDIYAQGAWLEAGVRTDTAQIIVLDRPLVRTLRGRVTPPAYTRMASTELTEQEADVTALTGSVVDLSVQSNKDLLSATLVLTRDADSATSDTTRIPMQVAGASARGRFAVSGQGAYSIEIVDRDGTRNQEPPTYRIVALTDAYPTITLVQPTQDVELTQQATVSVVASITDDYGFTRLRLYYRLQSSRYAQPEKNFRAIDIPLLGDATVRDVPYIWNLAKIDVTPEDTYEMYLEVADNDIVRGPKTARTRSVTVRMPSLDEVFAQADKTQTEMQRELKNLAKEAEDVRKEAEQLQRELQRQQSQQKQDVSWSDKKKAEELMQRQEQLQKRMDKVAETMEQMTEKLQQNKAISQETLQKYMELQKLMKEVKTPELQRMQEQMKRAMEQLSPEELQKMMKDFKFNEEEFRKNLDRQLNLLKRMQAEQKTDELQRRAEELARKQDELRQRSENANSMNAEERKKLAEEQRRLEEDLERLAQEAKDLQNLMKEIGQDMPQDKMDQAQKDLDPQGTKNQMDQASENLEKGDQQQASRQQQQASQNLQRFAQQMKQMKREMRRNSQKEAMRQMQKGVNDLVDLSKQQEALRDRMKNMDPNSSQYSQMAQQQQKLTESMQNIANSMMQLGQKSTSVSPEMAQELGDALQGMKDAMQSLSERNGQQAMQQQSGAMSSMNGAASKMSQALNSMMQGEGQGEGGSGQKPGQGQGRGQSPFQRLQQLAEDQQGINEGMQRIGQGGQQTDERQRAELGRLAGQQGRAMKALQELEQERRTASGSKKELGDLSQIAKDMQEVMSDMQSSSITPETRLRQERILSRLLDASRSMNDRDYEKSRESTSGQDVMRQGPKALDLQDLQRKASRTAMEQLRQAYTKDYENLIRQYYEVLQRQQRQGNPR